MEKIIDESNNEIDDLENDLWEETSTEWVDKWEKESQEWIQEEVDELDRLLSELEESETQVDDAISNVEDSWNVSPEVDKLLSELKNNKSTISDLQDSVKSLQEKIKSLNMDKSDLTYKNAELEAFGWVTDPQLMIVVRNFTKAKEWDKFAQNKIKSIISDIWSWIYWTDIEEEWVNDSIDAITEVDKYVSKKNPNVKVNKESWVPIF
jgi:DNA repair exonuclease SbcCD ATPase subunit